MAAPRFGGGFFPIEVRLAAAFQEWNGAELLELKGSYEGTLTVVLFGEELQKKPDREPVISCSASLSPAGPALNDLMILNS